MDNTQPSKWIPISTLPTESMSVRWRCIDGKEDLGFYYQDKQTFASFDLSSESEIIEWMPLKK